MFDDNEHLGELAMVAGLTAGTTVTITGGTGSFGSTTTSHLLTRGAGAIDASSSDEPRRVGPQRAVTEDYNRFTGVVLDPAEVGGPPKRVVGRAAVGDTMSRPLRKATHLQPVGTGARARCIAATARDQVGAAWRVWEEGSGYPAAGRHDPPHARRAVTGEVSFHPRSAWTCSLLPGQTQCDVRAGSCSAV